MKKFIIIPILATALALAACQAKQTAEPEKDTEKTEKTTETETIPTVSTADVDYFEAKEVAYEIILKEKIEETVKSLSPKGMTEKEYKESLGWEFYFYEAGKIKTDPYKDWSLLVLEKACDGPCPAVLYRFAWNKNTNKVINLENHSYKPYEEDYEWMSNEMKFLLEEIDSKTTIKSLELPETIEIPNSETIPDSNKVLTLAEKDVDIAERIDPETKENIGFTPGKVAFKDPVLGNIYFQYSEDEITEISCLYAVSPDGTVQRYAFDPGFFNEKDKDGNGAVLVGNSGELNLAKNFHNFETGCGVTAGCYYTLENVNVENLTLVATAGNGIELFGVKETLVNASDREIVKDASDEQIVIDEIYKIRGAVTKNSDYADPEKLQEFSDKNQVLFWKDPFGRYSYIAHNDIASAAECGKPVIYLYPEKEMDVKVAVGIDNITVSIPEHGRNGWTVSAKPNGEIYNYADKQSYPYLFWEGTDEETIKVTDGFVIARENVLTFLNESLTKLGLNSTEKKDFMDFWESRILENSQPYFYFTFLGTRDFNKIAPLSISPKPDTLIRVFMYYQPLNKKMTVRPQTLRSIPRKGFTVIEWGGTSNISFTK